MAGRKSRNRNRHRCQDYYEFYGYGAADDPEVVAIVDPVTEPPVVQNVEPEPIVDAGEIVPAGRDLRMIPASIGQQIFAITSGVAGGLAGFVLAYKMANAMRVNTAEVIIASLIAAAGSFGAIFAIRTFH